MASALAKERDYKYMATTYSKVNEMQVEFGKKLVVFLGVKSGDKVLDMGCGTGEVTSFTADQVGERGDVVGVDPDDERIKVAVQKHSDGRRNISFMAGNSSSHFPHFNEEYYDIHFSNFVFLWLTIPEKVIFLKTALKCLKPGGRIAMHSQEKNPEIFGATVELLPDDEIENSRTPFQLADKSTMEDMVKEHGFLIQSSTYEKYDHTYRSVDYYITSYCASCYIDESKIVEAKKKVFAKKFARDDGTVYLDMDVCRIVAKKPN